VEEYGSDFFNKKILALACGICTKIWKFKVANSMPRFEVGNSRTQRS